VSPVIDEVLTYPNPSSKPKKVGGVSDMPKHLSGDQDIRFLEERKQKKLHQQEEKLRRKAEREMKCEEEEAKRKQLEKATRGQGPGRRGRGRTQSQMQQSQVTRSISSSSATPRCSSDESDSACCPVCKFF